LGGATASQGGDVCSSAVISCVRTSSVKGVRNNPGPAAWCTACGPSMRQVTSALLSYFALIHGCMHWWASNAVHTAVNQRDYICGRSVFYAVAENCLYIPAKLTTRNVTYSMNTKRRKVARLMLPFLALVANFSHYSR